MPSFDFDFLKDRYDFELQRKEQLNVSLNLPVGILGGLGSLLALMARSFTYQDRVLTWIFVALVVAGIATFCGCLVQLARMYHRQKYMYLPLLGEFEKSRDDFLEFSKVMAGGEAEVLEAFESNLRRRIIEAADRNTANHDDRSSLMYWARVWLFVTLCLTALAGIPYV
jgi:hypothetical protein